MADRRKLAQGLMMMTPSARADIAQQADEFERFKQADYLRKMGEQGAGLAKSVARGVPQMATGLVDLASMPFEAAGVLQPGQAVGSTKWLENRGYLPESQPGFANQLTELLSGGFDPSDLVTKGLPALGMIGKTVWHGSPHAYDKFDMSKIGTGEGAQAYGHGLYLAEARPVAEEYATNLSKDVFNVGGELFNPADIKHLNVRAIARKGDIDSAIKKATELAASDSPVADLAKLDLDLLQQAKAKGGFQEATGYLYKVDLPDEQIAKMLDWDKPLSEQPQAVQDALHQAALVNFETNIGPKASGEIGDLGWTKNVKAMSGEDLYRKLTEGAFTNEMFLQGAKKGEAQAVISDKLRQAGIPGIQYLDQASRGAGEGTRNYVVFSDEIPQILERNGQPIAQALRNYETPQAQALREAEEYGQKMLGLPPGNTPMDRAIAGGFEPMYHGTADEIVNLNPEKYGSSTGAQSAKQGFWGVKTVPTAEGYANYAAKQAPVQKLLNEADAAGNKGDWDKYDDLLRQAEELETDVYNQPLRGQNVMPLMVNTKNAKIVDMGGAEYTDVEGGINQYLKQGKQEGKDVVVLENLSDDPGRSNMQTTHFGVLNPAAVRSQFAAFDPRYFGKPGLMLGAGGLGVYGALQGEDEYQ